MMGAASDSPLRWCDPYSLPGNDDAQPLRANHCGQELLLHPFLRFARGFVRVEYQQGGMRTQLE